MLFSSKNGLNIQQQTEVATSRWELTPAIKLKSASTLAGEVVEDRRGAKFNSPSPMKGTPPLLHQGGRANTGNKQKSSSTLGGEVSRSDGGEQSLIPPRP